LISLDLFLNWNARIARHDGFVDNVLKTVALAPIAITVAQSVYFLPAFNKRAQLVASGVSTPEEIWNQDTFFLKGHRAYITFDTLKISALAVAGLRFGLMLKN
jgi:hypothetical protein